MRSPDSTRGEKFQNIFLDVAVVAYVLDEDVHNRHLQTETILMCCRPADEVSTAVLA